MIQFYAPEIQINPILPPEESQHCCKVLRKREGDTVYVTDGKGTRYECKIEKASTKGTELEICKEEKIAKPWDYTLTLAVAVTKNGDRMSWLTEKATEIGVDRLIFLKCDNNERDKINLNRLRRNAISAMNQSLKTILPELEGLLTIEELTKKPWGNQKFFGYCDSETERKSLAKEIKKGEDVIILVGPEGDFSKNEVQLLKANHFEPTIFIDARLRTETAALFGLQTVHIVNEILR